VRIPAFAERTDAATRRLPVGTETLRKVLVRLTPGMPDPGLTTGLGYQ
jgi:hypothetical protein